MKALFPYKTLFGDLNFQLSNLTIDGEQPGPGLAPSGSTIDLTAVARDNWVSAAFAVEASAPSDEIAVFEAGGPLTMTSVAHCGRTNSRLALALTRSEVEPSKWYGRLELPRELFSGPVEVKCVLSGMVDGVAHRWLGEADSWTVYFDEPAIPVFDGTMPAKWDNFSEGELPELQQFFKEAFYASYDPDRPMLYLNREFPGLGALLKDGTRAGVDRAMHDTTRMAITTQVWAGLFNASLARVVEQHADDEPDDDPSWPAVKWQENVLRALISDMYSVTSPEDGLRQLREGWRSGSGVGHIQSQLLAAIQRRVNSRNLLDRALRAVDQQKQEERG